MDVCDLLEDILTAVELFTARKSVICKGLGGGGFLFLFDFLMRYSHCEVHHVSLSSRLKISFRKKSERPYQDWEALRTKSCVYLIPICLHPSSHGSAKFVRGAVIRGFSHSWSSSIIHPAQPIPPSALAAAILPPFLTCWESQLTLGCLPLPLMDIKLLPIITHQKC